MGRLQFDGDDKGCHHLLQRASKGQLFVHPWTIRREVHFCAHSCGPLPPPPPPGRCSQIYISCCARLLKPFVDPSALITLLVQMQQD